MWRVSISGGTSRRQQVAQECRTFPNHNVVQLYSNVVHACACVFVILRRGRQLNNRKLLFIGICAQGVSAAWFSGMILA